MRRKLFSFLLALMMVITILPINVLASEETCTANFQFQLKAAEPQGNTISVDLMLRSDQPETINGFQITFHGLASLTSAQIEGDRTDLDKADQTVYWFTANESENFSVGTEGVKLASLTFTASETFQKAEDVISVSDGSTAFTRDLFPAVAVAGKINSQKVPAIFWTGHSHSADGTEGDLLNDLQYTALEGGTYDTLPTDGNYYLAGDVTVSTTTEIAPGSTLNLCLNGNQIKLITKEESNNNRIFDVGGTLNVCSCTSQGEATADYTNGGLTLHGGFAHLWKDSSAAAAGSVNVNNVKFSNFATAKASQNGGVFYSANCAEEAPARIQIKNCEFSDNSAAKAGGVIYTTNYAEVVVENCTFSDNHAVSGGAVQTHGENNLIQITDSRFVGNYTSGGNGGAIYANMWTNGSFIKNCAFENNSTSFDSTRAGGAISLYNGDSGSHLFTIEDTTFTGNKAQAGGAISAGSGSSCIGTVLIKDCVFTDNIATKNSNAIRAFTKQSTTLDHCQVIVTKPEDRTVNEDVYARLGTTYIKNGNDIGNLLVDVNAAGVELTLNESVFAGDITNNGVVTIMRNEFKGELTGTITGNDIVWVPERDTTSPEDPDTPDVDDKDEPSVPDGDDKDEPNVPDGDDKDEPNVPDEDDKDEPNVPDEDDKDDSNTSNSDDEDNSKAPNADAEEPKAVVTTDTKKGQVHSETGVITGAGEGYSNWIARKESDGTISWKFEYADGTVAAGTIETRADGTTYEQPAWELINGKWFAFGADGFAKSTWVADEKLGGWFLVDMNLGMLTGWQQVNGIWYYLNPISDGRKGICLMNTWIDGWFVGPTGAWDGKAQDLTQDMTP